MKLVDRIYARFEARGLIPWWARVIWPWAHWCPEMDLLLILTKDDLRDNCFCDVKEKYLPPRGAR